MKGHRDPLIEPGFYYRALKDLPNGVKAGARLRVVRASHATNLKESGYIICSPEFSDIRLEENPTAQQHIIDQIDTYLKKEEPFDWPSTTAEYNAKVDREIAEREKREHEQDANERAQVHKDAQNAGISPKEAYRRMKEEERLKKKPGWTPK